MEGQLSLIRNLLDGNWGDDYLVVPPGHKIEGVYDWQEICRSIPSEEEEHEAPDS